MVSKSLPFSKNISSPFPSPFKYYLKRHWSLAVLGLGSLLITNSFDAMMPTLIGSTLDLLVQEKGFHQVAHSVGLILILTALLALFRFGWRFFWGQFHHSVAEDLRNRIYARYTELGPSFFQTQTTGELMSLINNDVNNFRMAVGPGILILLDSLFIMIVVPVLMWKISPTWTVTCLILMPLLPFVIRRLLKKSHHAYEEQQKSFSKVSGFAQEVISGIRVFKGYAIEEKQTNLFNKISLDYRDSSLRVAKIDSSYGPILEIATAVASVLLILISPEPISSGAVSLGQLYAFYQYIQKMVWPMEGIGFAMSHFQVGKASFKRIQDVINTQNNPEDHGTLTLDHFRSLKVKSPKFQYTPDSPQCLSLDGFEIQSGKILGVVGETGAGKSTLVDLICRNFDLKTPDIHINDLPIQDWTLKSLRSNISVVPQESFLFSRSILDNLTFGYPIDPKKIDQALETVCISDEVKSWPHGINTLLGEKGVNLSGGQKQRLCIARALLHPHSLLILDDSLSAIDSKTSSRIVEILKMNLQSMNLPRTVILISHRIDHLKWADQILVLKNGTQEAFGTHQDLLTRSETYQRLFHLQNESYTQ